MLDIRAARSLLLPLALLALTACGDDDRPSVDLDGGVPGDGAPADGPHDVPPTCGGGAMFVADHLIIPATGPRAAALGIARYRIVLASWEAHQAFRAAGFDVDGRLVVEGQWAVDAETIRALGETPSDDAVRAAMDHRFEDLDGARLEEPAELALWAEIAAYLDETPCVRELEPWVPYGVAVAALSTERGASARCATDSVASFREWLLAFPRLYAALQAGRLRDVPGVLAEPFRRAAAFNCCAGANTPWMGVTGCTCAERFGAAFPVRREYPDPSGGFGAEHVCEACPEGLEWSDRHQRCAAPLDGPRAPEVGACPSDGSGGVDYTALRARLDALDAASPFVVAVEVLGAEGGVCAPIQRTPLYVPCDASDGVEYLARPAGGAIDTNVTAGVLGSPQWLWHVSYAVQGMLDRGLLSPGDVDGTGSIYSTGFDPGTPAVTVCDDAMRAGPFGGRAIATPITAFPDRVVSEAERITAGLDPSRTWCADDFITKFSTSSLRCNPSRIRGSNFVLLFPETPACGGERPPEGVDGDASTALCVCPLDAPRWDPATRSCECADEGEAWDPIERRCRPEDRCFGALGSQCTPLQRDPAFTGLLPVSCGIDHVGPAPEGPVRCTADPFFHEVTDTTGRPMQWQSVGVGSLRHDQCCRAHPEGFFCGEHGSLFGACRREFNLAIADFLTPDATWGRIFDPERPSSSDIFVGGDASGTALTEYGQRLRAAAGADVRDGDAWVCASGETWQDARCASVCAPDPSGRGIELDGTDYPFEDRMPYDNPRPIYRQPTANSCGAAAVAMVLGDAGAIDEVITSCSLDDESLGTTALQLARELRARDRLYSPVRIADVASLVEIVEASGLPAIALIEYGDRTYHWVVLDEEANVDYGIVGECGTVSVVVRDSQAFGDSYVWSIEGLESVYAGVAVIPGSVLDARGADLAIDTPLDGPFATSWDVPVDGIAGPRRGALGPMPVPAAAIANPWPMLVRGWGPEGFVLWDDLIAIVPAGTPNTFTPDAHHERGFRYVWSLADGRRVQVWGHGPTGSANAGVNATSGATVRIRIGNRMLSQYLRTITVPNNTTRANETHIPLVDCPPEICLGVPTP